MRNGVRRTETITHLYGTRKKRGYGVVSRGNFMEPHSDYVDDRTVLQSKNKIITVTTLLIDIF